MIHDLKALDEKSPKITLKPGKMTMRKMVNEMDKTHDTRFTVASCDSTSCSDGRPFNFCVFPMLISL
jgi:hypothetical protein